MRNFSQIIYPVQNQKSNQKSLLAASSYVYIKLGGIAAEMVLFGIENAVDEIAEFVTDDYVSTFHLDILSTIKGL